MENRKFEFINNLIHTFRYSGKRLIVQESVSDHVLGMNELALEFVDSLEYLDGRAKKELFKELVYKISIHDFGESLYCDIPRNFKYHTEELGNLINKVEGELINELMPSWLAEDIDEAKSKDPEYLTGFVVAVLDTIQAGIKMKSEGDLGNKFFREEKKNALDVLYKYLTSLGLYKHHSYKHKYLEQFIIKYIDYIKED